MNEKKDMKTCIRPCVLMINECDKRYIIFKIFFTLIQGLLPATFIIIMQKIINLIQKKADVREILLYTCMYLVLLLLENINGNIEEFYTSKSIRKSIIQKYGVNPDYLIPTNLRLQLDETETYQKERYLTIVEPDNEEDADLYESNYIEKITDDILKKLTINGQIKSI